MVSKGLVVVGVCGLLGCDHGGAPPSGPTSAGSTSAASASTSSAPSASTIASAPASASAVASTPPPPPPLTVPSTWTPFASKKLGFSLSYPKDLFELKETAAQVTLLSKLSRDELGGDPKPKKWVYGVTLLVSKLTPEGYLEKEFKPFYTAAFPGKKFKETESITAMKVAGKDGYQLFAGVEGYNQRVVVLPRGKESFVLQLRSIGGVMGPNIPEDEQVKTFDQLLLSLKLD